MLTSCAIITYGFSLIDGLSYADPEGMGWERWVEVSEWISNIPRSDRAWAPGPSKSTNSRPDQKYIHTPVFVVTGKGGLVDEVRTRFTVWGAEVKKKTSLIHA